MMSFRFRSTKFLGWRMEFMGILRNHITTMHCAFCGVMKNPGENGIKPSGHSDAEGRAADIGFSVK